MSGLNELLTEFLEEDIKENPKGEYDDSEMKLTRFLNDIQEAGNDLSSWNEDDWWKALGKLGFAEEDIPDALETVAAWGVVDNFTWESTAEQKVWGDE